MTERVYPSYIRTLLHIYYIGEPFSNPDSDSIQAGLHMLQEKGMIMTMLNTPTGYTVTERGRVYAEDICNTPFPVQRWVPGERT